MLNFRIDGGQVVEVSAEFPKPYTPAWVNRNDFTEWTQTVRIAEMATALTGDQYVACDQPNMSPRFDVVRAPKVGDPVSYAFNGDYYPDGQVTKVSESLRVVRTSEGHTYYRRGQTASWVQTGGTWTLVQGHVNERNPHF